MHVPPLTSLLRPTQWLLWLHVRVVVELYPLRTEPVSAFCNPTLTCALAESVLSLQYRSAEQNPNRCYRCCGISLLCVLLYSQSQLRSPIFFPSFFVPVSCAAGQRGYVSFVRFFEPSVSPSLDKTSLVTRVASSNKCGRGQHRYGFKLRSLERSGALSRKIQSTPDPRLSPSSHCHRLQQPRPHLSS